MSEGKSQNVGYMDAVRKVSDRLLDEDSKRDAMYQHPFGRQFENPREYFDSHHAIDKVMVRLEAAELRISVLEDQIRMMEGDCK